MAEGFFPPPAALEHAAFEPHLGTTFGAEAFGASLALTLVEVEPLRGGGRGQRAPFALVFEAPAGIPVAQGIHRLVHAVLGELDVFLVPAQPGSSGPGSRR